MSLADFSVLFDKIDNTEIIGLSSDNTFGYLKLPPHKGSFGIIQGRSATGKTNLLCVIAAEWIKDNKSVLFLTDDRVQLILDKVSKNIPLSNKTDRNLRVMSCSSLDKNINDYLKILFTEEYYDIVIVDSIRNKNINFLELSRQYDTFMITSMQENTEITKISEAAQSIKKSHQANFIISINKVVPKKLAWYIKLFDYLCFWKPKRVNPNTTLKILKNRYGKHGEYNFVLDYDNMTMVPTDKIK